MIRRVFKGVGPVLRYIKRRLGEKSTWAGISAGIPGAALLPPPWSIISFVFAAALVLAPEGKGSSKVEGE